MMRTCEDENWSETANEQRMKLDDKARPSSDASKSTRLRLCQLKHWPHYAGYGFQLHVSRVVRGEFIIHHVETRSPAAAAGLLPGDHVIQVLQRQTSVLTVYSDKRLSAIHVQTASAMLSAKFGQITSYRRERFLRGQASHSDWTSQDIPN